MSKLILLLLILFLALHPSSPRPEPYAMRISCGARLNVHTAPTNTLWYKDFGYTGGRPANASPTSYIAPPLKTLRYFPLSDGPENCYNIKRVPKGHYAVRIFFALVAEPNFENEPLFDVSIQGSQIYSLRSGWSTSDDQSFTEALVFVADGSLSSCVHSTGHGDPAILSFEILQVDDKAYYFGSNWGQGTILRTAKRLNCGSTLSKFDADYNGDHWGGDRFWHKATTFQQSSGKVRSVESKIKKASVSPNFYPEEIYQTALISTDSLPELSYNMDVDPNRNYSIWLHFAEIDVGITNVGQRIFDILINGDIAFKDVDIIRMSGGAHMAIVLNKTIAVNGRTLTITIHPTKGNAIINAIEVFEVIPAESKTLTEEVGALQTLKNALGLPLRFGWNGDPCVPQQHPWSGVDCLYDKKNLKWVIDGLTLDNQALRGFLSNDISKLHHLQSINLSGNSIHGTIPSSLGTITGLEVLDLSFNFFNGSIPESLGMLTSLKRLNLNGNLLSGRVPAALGGRLLHRASFKTATWAGLGFSIFQTAQRPM
ncbi:PREDICTED: receptor-like protein kinase At5g59670 isoform X2 [Nelumbo nucifera]|uniref:Receptor-like protein kinase At5g59670 isoform X2 n=1 Tax=Nelumbo nucifera TaxID=4432 RepID=A0A1U8A256_NELNU|nr:PREDICTED: receptor-like protein kinase At5g59670 isoform X2 [Nelumbo nucifera]